MRFLILVSSENNAGLDTKVPEFQSCTSFVTLFSVLMFILSYLRRDIIAYYSGFSGLQSVFPQHLFSLNCGKYWSTRYSNFCLWVFVIKLSSGGSKELTHRLNRSKILCLSFEYCCIKSICQGKDRTGRINSFSGCNCEFICYWVQKLNIKGL